MDKKTEITEQDLYKFVFSPDLLDEAKLNYVQQNRERFSDEIELLLEMKNTKQSEKMEIISDKVYDKINSSKTIELFPILIKSPDEFQVSLAAASPIEVKKSNSSTTFRNEEWKILIRHVKTMTQSFLYIFTDDNKGRKYSLQLVPSQKIYNVFDISMPIEISDEINIAKIILQID